MTQPTTAECIALVKTQLVHDTKHGTAFKILIAKLIAADEMEKALKSCVKDSDDNRWFNSMLVEQALTAYREAGK